MFKLLINNITELIFQLFNLFTQQRQTLISLFFRIILLVQ
jgi:hypothetical protein